MQTEQHASFNDFIDDDAGLAVKPFLAGKDVSCRDEDIVRKEVFNGVRHCGSCARMS
jgi:hypothetical protein